MFSLHRSTVKAGDRLLCWLSRRIAEWIAVPLWDWSFLAKQCIQTSKPIGGLYVFAPELMQCLYPDTPDLQRLMVQGLCLFRCMLWLTLVWHDLMSLYMTRSCVSAARLTSGLRLPDGSGELEECPWTTCGCFMLLWLLMHDSSHLVWLCRSTNVAEQDGIVEEPGPLGQESGKACPKMGPYFGCFCHHGYDSMQVPWQHSACTLAGFATQQLVEHDLRKNKGGDALPGPPYGGAVEQRADRILDYVPEGEPNSSSLWFSPETVLDTAVCLPWWWRTWSSTSGCADL